DRMSELARRYLMTHAERAVLLRRSKAVWRMGHGSPAPHELFMAGGNPHLMIPSGRGLRELIAAHRQFVFLAREPGDRMVLSLGHALRPLEYAVVMTLADRMDEFFEALSYGLEPTGDVCWDGRPLRPTRWVCRFRDEVAAHVVVGVYRASPLAPA